MKRFSLSILLSVFASLVANADSIDASQALDIARATLTNSSENGSRKAAMANCEMRIILQDELLTEPAWYVVTPVSGEGFVIVSGDDSEDEVIGYSTEGTADAESMPPALRALLEDYANHIALVRQGLVTPAVKDDEGEEYYRPSQLPSSVPHLVTAEWHQGSPFNNLCPIIDGSTCLVGCVALSMAQVMHYYKYPTSGTGTVQSMSPGSQISSLNLDEIVFDYDNMPDNYSEGYTEEQANEVATLCLACGYASIMNYTPTFSSTYMEDQCRALINRFNYSSSTRIIVRTGALTNDKKWKNRLKEELVEGRPIIITGYHATHGGHNFICDGYSSLKFHINWGWGPGNPGITYNGYYNILTLVPAGESGGYTDMQQFLIGIKPAVEGEDPSTQYFIAANDSISDYAADGHNVSFTVPALTNATDSRLNGSLFGLISDVYGNTLQECNLSSLEIRGKKDCNPINVGLEVSSDTNDGNYYLNLLYKPNNSEYYQKIESWYNKTVLRLTISAGQISSVTALTEDEAASDMTSGIKDIHRSADNSAIYNLQGQRVNNPQKGVFIKNGKKILYQ